jgi:hypothetical protein
VNRFCKLIDVLHAALHCHEQPSFLRIRAVINGVSFTATEGDTVDILDTAVPGSATFSIPPVTDAKGRPVKVVPKWALQDGATNCSITSQAADGLSAVVHIGDAIAAEQLSVTATNADGTTASANIVLNVMPGDATKLGDITASAITADPAGGTGGGGTPAALATSFPNRKAFEDAVLAFTGKEGVTIDGVNVGAGSPILAYFTHSATGGIDMVAPTN